MKNKLAIFLLSAVMAVSGTVAVGSLKNDAKAQENNLYGELFSYDSSEITLTANKSAPDYLATGISGLVYDETELAEENRFKQVNYVDNVGMGFSAVKDTTFSLNSPIYLGDNDITTPLIEFMITPKTPVGQTLTNVPSTAKEFHRLVMVLTDVNNPNVYVELSAHFSATNSAQTWLQVSTPTQERAGYNRDTLTSEVTNAYGQGMGIQSSFTGGNKYMSTIYYSAEEMALYAYRSYYSSSLPYSAINVVRDLNDPMHLLPGDMAFEGFSSNYVNVTFRVEGLNADSANFIIRSIDGQTFNYLAGEIVDDGKPSLSVDSKIVKNVPKGEINKKYPFAPCSAYDIIDGNDVDVTVEVFDANGNKITTDVYNDYFIPKTAGEHTIKYFATDSVGNTSKVVETKALICEVLEDFKLNFVNQEEIVYESPVGVNIVAPEVQLTGGSGNNTLKQYICKGDTGEVVSNYKIYAPKTPGWYKIVYEYKDYLSKTYTFAIDVNVTLRNEPVFSKPSMPVAVLSGKKFYIPSVKATDYASFNGEGKDVECIAEIKVEGVDKNDAPISVDWTEVKKDFYTVTAVSGTLSLRYKAKPFLGKKDYAYSDVYTSEIVSLSTQKELYKFFKTTENVTANDIILNGIDTQTAFTPSKTGESIQFINKLPESSFASTINFDKDYVSIKEFKVVLQDSENADEKVTLTYTPNDTDTSYVKINNEKFRVNGSFMNVKKVVGGELLDISGKIVVKLRNGLLYDGEGYVASIPCYDSGVEFKGFSTGKIYFSVIFSDVDEDMVNAGKASSVRFTDFCGTARFASAGRDRVVPNISLSRDLSTYYDVNSYVTLPSAFAVDLIDPDVSVTLTVTDPLGNAILNKVSADEERVLHLDKIGQYIVEYTSLDQNNNKGNMQIAVYSADTFDPVIEIAGQFKSTAKVTDTYKIHKAIAYDNNDQPEDLVIYVYVFGPDGYVETVAYGPAETEDVEYKFSKVGTYRIRYYVMDSYGNYVHKVFYVTAS